MPHSDTLTLECRHWGPASNACSLPWPLPSEPASYVTTRAHARAWPWPLPSIKLRAEHQPLECFEQCQRPHVDVGFRTRFCVTHILGRDPAEVLHPPVRHGRAHRRRRRLVAIECGREQSPKVREAIARVARVEEGGDVQVWWVGRHCERREAGVVGEDEADGRAASLGRYLHREGRRLEHLGVRRDQMRADLRRVHDRGGHHRVGQRAAGERPPLAVDSVQRQAQARRPRVHAGARHVRGGKVLAEDRRGLQELLELRHGCVLALEARGLVRARSGHLLAELGDPGAHLPAQLQLRGEAAEVELLGIGLRPRRGALRRVSELLVLEQPGGRGELTLLDLVGVLAALREELVKCSHPGV
mmetsp:Transcript_19001/g.63644  ORF Transcript_19001/g.63644 Transcript_19001/m.63644 type:complete len:359 (-) Transcript_19001:219-1295(-)